MRSPRRRLLAFALGAALFAATAPTAVAFAQDDAEEVDPAEERAAAFEAAEDGAQTENIPGGMLMVTAYGIIWVLLLGYVVSLGLRQSRTMADLDRLEDELLARGAGRGSLRDDIDGVRTAAERDLGPHDDDD